MITIRRRVAARVLRLSMVNRALCGLARARGRRLVLVYHRLGPSVAREADIVPSIPPDVFRAQLQRLGEVVDFVTLEQLLDWETARPVEAKERRRPVVAVTFDDDLPSHVSDALPVLRELRVPATFFLSGRVLHGLGAYWFQQLEALLVTHGAERAASLLGLPVAGLNGSLVRRFEQSAALRSRLEELAADLPASSVLDREGLSRLAAAGMTIGFHTVDHDLLQDMHDEALQQAVTRGRSELAAATGARIQYFAYPYGKTDTRSAAAVRRAGFCAAFTGRPEAVRRGDDRYRLGRWEPGPIGVDDLLVKLAVRLHRAAPKPADGLL